MVEHDEHIVFVRRLNDLVKARDRMRFFIVVISDVLKFGLQGKLTFQPQVIVAVTDHFVIARFFRKQIHVAGGDPVAPGAAVVDRVFIAG